MACSRTVNKRQTRGGAAKIYTTNTSYPRMRKQITVRNIGVQTSAIANDRDRFGYLITMHWVSAISITLYFSPEK